ncbi:hypothetical protein PCH_Pc24g02070 [Penicillium rubens Wisconsin 54-1255]|uniref:Uncharacterized protein n=1 Tax=Penicillium rubens (strain ATCC 28089 / DSM 1075 / NRRL 1951 / Wisconsin 54-1255) TaxID=500485 RepID=B6HWY9_PENRW|nr:hypothetical protein PCH_Pc24g02070 [Penicillium rubens Wisconsin 54-1255]
MSCNPAHLQCNGYWAKYWVIPCTVSGAYGQEMTGIIVKTLDFPQLQSSYFALSADVIAVGQKCGPPDFCICWIKPKMSRFTWNLVIRLYWYINGQPACATMSPQPLARAVKIEDPDVLQATSVFKCACVLSTSLTNEFRTEWPPEGSLFSHDDPTASFGDASGDGAAVRRVRSTSEAAVGISGRGFDRLILRKNI